MINNFTSLDTLFSTLVSELDLETVPHHELVEWTRTVLQTIGGGIESGQWELARITLPIIDHYVALPGDFYCINEGEFFHKYKVVNNALILAPRTGTVEVSYLAFLKDDEGNLLFPDDVAYKQAVRWYFLSMKALQGKAASPEFSFEKCNGYYMQKVWEARGNANMPNIHTVQGVAIDRLNMRYDTNPLAHGFRNQGKVYNRTSRGTTNRRY